MTDAPRVSYVIPVHNAAGRIETTVSRLVERLSASGGQIILVENASSDNSFSVCAKIASKSSGGVEILAIQSSKGLGSAYRAAIPHIVEELTVLSADDLPFAFTDLDSFLAKATRPRIAIGSKAHPASRLEVSLQRRAMTWCFYLLRRLVLGLRQKDTQGTLLAETAVLTRAAPYLQCKDYLISTEIVAVCKRMGINAAELPIVYIARTGSNVSVWRDSLQMAAGLVSLACRIRRLHPAPTQ